MRTKYILTFFLGIITELCSAQSNDSPLSLKDGTKIITSNYLGQIELKSNKTTTIIPLQNRDKYDYSLPVFAKDHNFLYIKVRDKEPINECWQGRICKINLKGEIVNTLYIAPKCIDIIHFSVSPNDSLILITKCNHFDWLACTPNTGGWVHQPFHHLIYDIATNSTIDSVSLQGFLYFDRLNPIMWSPNSKKVMIFNRLLKNVCETNEGGTPFYVYDLKTKQKQFVSCGLNFSWNPKLENIICYSKHSDLYFYNINTQQHEKFISIPNHDIEFVRWSSDGTTILIRHYKTLKREKIVTGDHVTKCSYTLINTISKKEKTHKGFLAIDNWQ